MQTKTQLPLSNLFSVWYNLSLLFDGNKNYLIFFCFIIYNDNKTEIK